MSKKSNRMKILFGGISIIVLASVLIMNVDQISDFTELGAKDLTIKLPITTSSLLGDDPNFKNILNSPTSAIFIECKLKHTVDVLDVNQKIIKSYQSSGIEGSPVTLSLQDFGKEVYQYKVSQKAFCKNLFASSGDIILEQSPMKVEVKIKYPNITGETIGFSGTQSTTKTTMKSGDPEKIILVSTIPAKTIEDRIVNKDSSIKLTFRTFGNLNVSFPLASATYTYPIQYNDLVTSFNQFKTAPQPTAPQPTPTQPITVFGNNADTTAPIEQKICNDRGDTWYIGFDGKGLCSSVRVVNGQFCKVVDLRKSTSGEICSDPVLSSTVTTGGGVDNVNPSTGDGTTMLSLQDLRNDVIKGKVETRITFDYPTAQDKTVLATSLGSTSQGVFQTASLLAGSTQKESPTTVSNLVFETFYLRDTLAEAQALKLTQSGLTFKPVLTVGGEKITMNELLRSGSDIGLNGKSLGDGKFGFSLGKVIIPASLIESTAKPKIGQNSVEKVSLSVTSEGFMLVQLQGQTQRLQLVGETVTLTNLVVSNSGATLPPIADDGVNNITSCPSGEVLGITDGKVDCVAGSLSTSTGVLVCQFLNQEISERPCTKDFRIQFCGGESNTNGCTVPTELKPKTTGDCKDAVTGVVSVCSVDTDGDGKLDAVDQCPFQPASTSDGCPLQIANDIDKDGIPDDIDQCPTQPETYNGYQDNDGCPDTRPDNTCPECHYTPPKYCTTNAQGQLDCTPNDDTGGMTDMILIIGAVMVFVIAIIVLIAKRR